MVEVSQEDQVKVCNGRFATVPKLRLLFLRTVLNSYLHLLLRRLLAHRYGGFRGQIIPLHPTCRWSI